MSLKLIAAGMLGLVAPRQVRAAAELERVRLCGEAVGLSREEIDEVIKVWVDWYQQSPWPLDWSRVRSAITCRGVGAQWRPTG